MTPNELIIMDEARRLRLPYSRETDVATAIHKALGDLVSAKDYQSKPLDARPTKMAAVDFLRLVAMVLPEEIDDRVLDACINQFANCNESSKMVIIMIMALSNNADAIPFLENVIADIADPKDWVQQTAHEAIQVLRGELEIGWGNDPNRWIKRIIKAQE